MKLTDTTTNILVFSLNDVEEPFSPALEETAVGVTGCLTNVLQSASGATEANRASTENQSSSKVT